MVSVMTNDGDNEDERMMMNMTTMMMMVMISAARTRHISSWPHARIMLVDTGAPFRHLCELREICGTLNPGPQTPEP